MEAIDAGSYQAFVIPGLILIVLGVILVAIPFLVKIAPSIQNVSPILIWVYKGDGFYFVTSPIMIIISLVSLALYFLRARS